MIGRQRPGCFGVTALRARLAFARHGLWYRYVPESGNWHGGTLTRRLVALSAAPLCLVSPGIDIGSHRCYTSLHVEV